MTSRHLFLVLCAGVATFSSGCLYSGDRTSLITVTAGPTTSAFDKGVAADVASALAATVNGVDGEGDTEGWFKDLDPNTDAVYLNFQLNEPAVFQSMTVSVQHPFQGTTCMFEVQGVSSAGTTTTLVPAARWTDATSFVNAPESKTFSFSTNTVSYSAYRLVRASGTCKSPGIYEVTFGDGVCTSAPTAAPTAQPTTAAPTTPTPTMAPTTASPTLATEAPTTPTPTRKVEYKVDDWGACSATCGSGQRQRKVTCVYSPGGDTATDAECKSAGIGKPPATEACQAATLCSCTIPAFANGMEGQSSGTTPACVAGSVLSENTSCAIGCKKGFSVADASTSSILGTYNCNSANGKLAAAFKPAGTATTCACKLPSSLGAAVIGNGALPCSGNQILDFGKSCSVGCATGFSTVAGTTSYSCDKVTGLTLATLICSVEPCTLPALLNPGVTGDGVMSAGGCVPGMTLQPGGICRVQCGAGHNEMGGTKQFNCNQGQLVQATLTCSAKPCQLPVLFSLGVEPATVNGCTPGVQLFDGQQCSVQCSATQGYSSRGGTTMFSCEKGNLVTPNLKCTTDTCVVPAMPTYLQGSGANGCIVGARLNSAAGCQVECMSGMTPVGTGTTSYRCYGGVLTAPTLQCESSPCKIPAVLGDGVEGLTLERGHHLQLAEGVSFPLCVPGNTMMARTSCVVQCAPGYVTVGGNFMYTCDEKSVLARASLQCAPSSCTITQLGEGMIAAAGASSPGCDLVNGQKQLKAGESCAVQCNPNGWRLRPSSSNSNVGFYTCSSKLTPGTTVRTLQEPDLQCIPFLLTVAPSFAPVAACPYAKDAFCFDGLYPCAQCCTTGQNVFGASCWDGIYSYKRCCNYGSGTAAPTFTPVAMFSADSTCPYERDSVCFDGTYPCEQCCTTGLSIRGDSCWDGYYTKSRCCKGATEVVPPPTPSPTNFPAEEVLSLGLTPAPVYAPALTCPFALDNECFSSTYPCEQCCRTDKSVWGDSCWDEVYTKERCCRGAAPPPPPTAAPFAFIQPPVFFPPPATLAPVAALSCTNMYDACFFWAQIGHCSPTSESYQFVYSSCPGSCNPGCRSSRRTLEGIDSRGHRFQDMRLTTNTQGELVDSRGRSLPKPGPKSQPDESSPISVGAIVGICAAVIGVFAIIVLVVIKLRDFQKNSADTEMRSSEIQSERVSV